MLRVAGHPGDRDQHLLAAVLAAGRDDAALSHLSAAEVWGLPAPVSARPELLVARPGTPRIDGVTVHTTDRLPDAHLTVQRGLPVTTVARTAFDVSARVGPQSLQRIIGAALRRPDTTLAALWSVHDLLTGRGRRRVARFREALLAWNDGVRPGDSAKELDVGRLLVGAGLPRPAQQFLVVVGGAVFELDLAYPDVLLDIEYDGWGAHSSRASFDADRARDASLIAAGWTVLRFTRASTPSTIVATVLTTYERLLRADRTAEGGFREKIGG